MIEETAGPAPGRLARVAQDARTVWLRLPFTTTIVAAMLVLGLVTGSLLARRLVRALVSRHRVRPASFAAGRWWTLVTGVFFASSPWYYLPMVASFALFAGWAEHRMGTRLAAAVTIGGHLFAVLGAALLLLAVRGLDWAWATQTAALRDVGFSAGALTAAAVASALVRPPWRLRLRLGLVIYVIASAIYIGSLADLEHLLGVAAGLAVGPQITRSLNPPAAEQAEQARVAPARRGRAVRCVAVTSVVTYLVPDDGPLGPRDDNQDLIDLCITLLLIAAPDLGSPPRASGWPGGSPSSSRASTSSSACSSPCSASSSRSSAATSTSTRAAALRRRQAAVDGGLRDAHRRSYGPSACRRAVGCGEAPRPPRSTSRPRCRCCSSSGGGTLSWMATWPENTWFRTPDGESFVAYQRHAGVAIGLGDPVGPEADRGEAVRDVRDPVRAQRLGAVPVLGHGGDRGRGGRAGLAAGAGRRGHPRRPARPAVPRQVLAGRALGAQQGGQAGHHLPHGHAGRRAVVARGAGAQPSPRSGSGTRRCRRWASPSAAWTRRSTRTCGSGSRRTPTGRCRASRRGCRCTGATARCAAGRWTSCAAATTGRSGRSSSSSSRRAAWRSSPRAPQFVSLSGAPLARAEGRRGHGRARPAPRHPRRALEPMYGFRSLHAFKNKFAPRYEPMYLVFRDEADLPRIGIALTRAYLPDTPLRDLVRA